MLFLRSWAVWNCQKIKTHKMKKGVQFHALSSRCLFAIHFFIIYFATNLETICAPFSHTTQGFRLKVQKMTSWHKFFKYLICFHFSQHRSCKQQDWFQECEERHPDVEDPCQRARQDRVSQQLQDGRARQDQRTPRKLHGHQRHGPRYVIKKA